MDNVVRPPADCIGCMGVNWVRDVPLFDGGIEACCELGDTGTGTGVIMCGRLVSETSAVSE